MKETANQVCPVRNEHFAKERQEWLTLYESACQRLGGRRWREKNRARIFAKVESQLWQVMRAKGMHHVSFWRKCQLAREALLP